MNKDIIFSIKRFLFPIGIFLFIISPSFIKAQNYFRVTTGIKEAYKSIMELKLDKAQLQLNNLKASEPKNMLIYHIENYIDFYKIFINEDYNEFVKLEKNKNYRLDKIESGNEDSPYHKFSRAEIKLQWALARIKFEEYFTAAFELRSAYKLLNKNKSEHPDFIANYKSLSVINAIIGTTPKSLNILKRLTGISGTIKQGANEIKNVIEYSKQNEFLFKEEAYTISSFIAFHLENNKEKAWRIISAANLDTKNSPLACFVLANMAQKTGRNDQAISILKERPKDDGRLPFYYLDYMLGKSKLYKQDKDAISYLKLFVDNFKGINYIKDAYLKIAWYELIVNNSEKAYWSNIEKCTYKGKAVVDEDKVAYFEATNAKIPNPTLLKARLLSDGSYFFKAYNYLIENEKYLNKSKENKLEFNYRMGRILQSLRNYTDAIKYLDKTIQIGKNAEEYFACNAALQIGRIYENQNKYKSAKKYYKKCLNINPNEYKNSIHQKAKAGLSRIKT